MTDARSPWRATGNTDEASFIRAISRVANGSPPSPMAAEAKAVHRKLSEAGLSRLGAAMAWHERKNDSWPRAYGLDSSFKNPWAMKLSNGSWARYRTYEEAAGAWTARLLSPTGPYANTKTMAELIAVYAPASDNNDEAAYVRTISAEIDALPEVKSMKPNPFTKPVIHDVVADAAIYGLTKAQGERLRQNRMPNRNGYTPQAIVLHIQEGTSKTSLAYWLNTPGVQASSNVMVNRDGTLLRIIWDVDGPWTNGDVNSPSARGQAIIARNGNTNPNNYSLTIEAEGYATQDLTPAQATTLCWMVWEWMNRYNLTIDDIYRHADFNNVTRSNCPGVYYPKVIAMLQNALGGQPVSRKFDKVPDLITDEMIAQWFPEADPLGVITNAWIDYGIETGHWPSRTRVVSMEGQYTRRVEFSNGLVIWGGGGTALRSDEL